MGALDLLVVPRLEGVGAGALARVRDQTRCRTGSGGRDAASTSSSCRSSRTRGSRRCPSRRRATFSTSKGIKKLEPFYGFVRQVDLPAAARAIIRCEARIESGDAAGAPDELRAERIEIEGYNRDDCLWTLRLTE